MVTCKHCSSPNTLDSKFCRRCGTVIPIPELEEAQVKLDVLVAEGVAAFNAGRTDEALAIAETALASNPRMVNALSLASDCHARRQEFARALEYADQIVDQNPDSELDRIKRNQLRTQLEKTLEVPAGPDKRMALAAALAAVVLFGSIGALLVKVQQDNAARDAAALESRQNLVASNGNVDPGLTDPVGDPQNGGVQTPQTNQGAAPIQSNQAPQNNGGATQMEPPNVNSGRTNGLPPYNGSTLPNPTGDGQTRITPLDPGDVSDNNPTGGSGGGGGTNSNPPKPPVGEDPDPTTSVVQNNPEPDPGQIEIKIRQGSTSPRPNPAGGGSVPVVDGNGATALMRTAREQQQSGNLSGAAGSYEKALAAGGDPISINQRLGNIYSQLGRNTEAVNSYQRAMNAAQAAVSAGNSVERNRAIVDSCQAAIRVLRGG